MRINIRTFLINRLFLKFVTVEHKLMDIVDKNIAPVLAVYIRGEILWKINNINIHITNNINNHEHTTRLQHTS